MWRKPSFYLFLITILLVFGTFYVPSSAKSIFIWLLSISGFLLSLVTARTGTTLSQRFVSVFTAACFIGFAFLLSEAFQVF